MSNPKVEVLAYLPPIQSAIMKSGDGDLLQVKFNINLLISPDAVAIMLMTGKRLKLTVQEYPEKANVKKGNNAQKTNDGQGKDTRRKQRYPYRP
jgi:hypothetical protein